MLHKNINDNRTIVCVIIHIAIIKNKDSGWKQISEQVYGALAYLVVLYS